MGIFVFALTSFLVRKTQSLKNMIVVDNYEDMKVQYIEFIKRWEECHVLFMGFKNKNHCTQSFLLVFISRIIVFNLIIAYFFEYPLAQAIMITTISILMLMYILIVKPFRREINYI